jgi:hypothetical protein
MTVCDRCKENRFLPLIQREKPYGYINVGANTRYEHLIYQSICIWCVLWEWAKPKLIELAFIMFGVILVVSFLIKTDPLSLY